VRLHGVPIHAVGRAHNGVGSVWLFKHGAVIPHGARPVRGRGLNLTFSNAAKNGAFGGIREEGGHLRTFVGTAAEMRRVMSIALSNLTREDEVGQMSLFGDEDSGRRARDVKLDKAVDALRSKFGADIIQRGTVMKDGLQVARKFKGKQASKQEKT
ncbi:MAG: hypothetical protein II885_01620, partial [Oscillospiraceae bacterium]|nr:hypothetical protein [Oscillospiraceae bacterium]